MSISIKKTRKKIRIEALAVLIFTLVLGAYLFTSTALRSINVSMSVNLQNNTVLLSELESQNQNLSKEIQRLSDYDRVMAIAKAAGLSLNGDNVVEFTSGQ